MVFFFQRPVPNSAGWVPNLTPASHYGAFEFIFDQDDRPYSDPKASLLQAERKLAQFNPDVDYICWPSAGDVFSIYLAMGVLSSKGFKKVRALMWQKPKGSETGGYMPVDVPLNSLS
jgi:hypothetical protein